MKDKILKNKKVIIPIVSILLILVIVGVSFAYYSATVNKVSETETTIRTNGLAITFNGTKEINYQNMIPGDSFEKTFTVTNESNKTVDFNIYMQNITNQYNEDLVYTIVDDLNTTIVSESKLPNTNTSKNYLKTGIEIAAGATRTYTMTIEYKYLIDQPQNDYQGKVFNATLGIDTNQNAIANSDLTLSTKSINANDITDGGSVTRTFTVTNTTDETQLYNVKLVDVTNTYANGVTYTLSKNNTQVIASTALPSSDTTILTNQVIASGATDTYTLTISYDSTQAMIEGFMLLSNGTNEFSASIRTESRIAGVEKTIGEKLDLSTVTGEVVTKTITVTNYASSAKTFNLNLNEIAENYVSTLDYIIKKNDSVIATGSIESLNTALLENASVAANTTDTYAIEFAKPVYTCTGNDCPKCVRAETLHTEECNQSNYYCAGDNYQFGSLIKYGNETTTDGELNTGDAFDCDVNGDHRYDPQTERFYYVYTKTNGITTDSNTAVLAYYANTIDGEPSLLGSNWNTLSDTSYGPITSRDNLPTTLQWSNIQLISLTTDITYGTYYGSVRVNDFSYEGHAARLLTYQEVTQGCTGANLSTKCKFLFENTKYASNDSQIYGIWLSSINAGNAAYIYTIGSANRNIGQAFTSDVSGNRPAIEVAKTDIDY